MSTPSALLVLPLTALATIFLYINKKGVSGPAQCPNFNKQGTQTAGNQNMASGSQPSSKAFWSPPSLFLCSASSLTGSMNRIPGLSAELSMRDAHPLLKGLHSFFCYQHLNKTNHVSHRVAWVPGSSTELDSALAAANAIGQAFSDSTSIVNLGVQTIAERLTAGANLLLDSLISLLGNGDRVQASQIATQGQSSINVGPQPIPPSTPLHHFLFFLATLPSLRP